MSSSDTQQLLSAVKPSWGKHKSSCGSQWESLPTAGSAKSWGLLRDQIYTCRKCILCSSSLEVSPCLEPSYCLQKTRTMKFSSDKTEDVGLVKYLPKSLLLPINTFAGVIQ